MRQAQRAEFRKAHDLSCPDTRVVPESLRSIRFAVRPLSGTLFIRTALRDASDKHLEPTLSFRPPQCLDV